MDAANLRRKDTTKGAPLRVLSLDGGGVRGYSMLIILNELMYRAFVETEGKPPKREEIPKPCDYFDLIAGTGTGGLIAIMLGRLRLDLETCMDVYVRMTKKVFETDKTIAGIPYKTTLFKASKLEEAIKACVQEHTIYEDEGNDGTAQGGREFQSATSPMNADVRRSMSARSTMSNPSTPGSFNRNSMVSQAAAFSPRPAMWGNADASLYDGRENRTKTAVTAVYKGTNPKTGGSVLLRSYDSRKEPPPEFNCTIWQAGRATSATGLAFKPIQIGQSAFLDEGAGKYNPAPQILEEAVVNEWPGRELGIFVSIGTGKRPSGTNQNQHEWWEGFVGGSVGSFAEARRRLIAKIEGCEDTHLQMMNTELPKRGIPLENYCRLNVEVGVGEFGMNEWDRLSDMNTGTRRYLSKQETADLTSNAAHKIAKIELTKRRMEQGHQRVTSMTNSNPSSVPSYIHNSSQDWPAAVELPAEDVVPVSRPPRISQPQIHFRTPSNPPYPDDRSHTSRASSQDKFVVTPGDSVVSRISGELPYRNSSDKIPVHNGQLSYDYRTGYEAPPIPPKTPINEPIQPVSQNSSMLRSNGNMRLPYPDDDGPPPVSKLRKPQYNPT